MLCKAPQILNMQKHFKGMHTESAQSIPSAAAAAAAAAAALVLVREPLLQHLPRAAAAQPLAPSDMRLAESITIMLLSSSPSVVFHRCLGTTSQSPNSCQLEAPQCLLAQHANPLVQRPGGALQSSLALCMKLLAPLKSELFAKPPHHHLQLHVLGKCMDECDVRRWHN